MTSPLDNRHEGVGTQAHYNALPIQPIEFILSHDLDFLEGNVVKYVSRYPFKNGLEDLRKAAQYLDWLIDREIAFRRGKRAVLVTAIHFYVDRMFRMSRNGNLTRISAVTYASANEFKTEVKDIVNAIVGHRRFGGIAHLLSARTTIKGLIQEAING